MIALAVQRNTDVYVYDEKNFLLYYRYGQLVSFTGSSVSIKRDGCIFVYDEKGNVLFYRNI